MEKNLLTVLVHPLDQSKSDVIYEDVMDINHTWGNDGVWGDNKFHQTLRLLIKKDEKSEPKRVWIQLNDNTVEIAMQKGEQNNG